MSNQTKLYNDLVELNSYLKRLVANLTTAGSMNLDKNTAYRYEGRVRQLDDCIVLIEDVLDKNAYVVEKDVEKVADKKLVKEVITRFYK